MFLLLPPVIQFSLVILTFPLLSFSYPPPFPSLISLNCTLPLSENIPVNDNNYTSIQILIDHITNEVTKTKFITSAIYFGPYRTGRLVGLIECRLNLSPVACTLCAQIAKVFGGTTNFHDPCSNRTRVATNPVHRSEPAFEALLLRLKSDNKTVTFSGGDLQHCDYFNEATVNEFGACLGRLILNISGYCGGERGAAVVNGYCSVRFGSLYVSGINSNGRGSPTMGDNRSTGGLTVYGEDKNDGIVGDKSFKRTVVAAWGGGVTCCVVFIFFVWVLKRSIVDTAKVGNGDES